MLKETRRLDTIQGQIEDSGWLNDSCYLQLSECIVTLLLTWSLLSAHGDKLVDAVCDCPVDAEVQLESQVRRADKQFKNMQGANTALFVQGGQTESSPSSSCQLVLEVGGAWVSGQGFSCQQQLAGGHGDCFQIGHHLCLVFFRLKQKNREICKNFTNLKCHL